MLPFSEYAPVCKSKVKDIHFSCRVGKTYMFTVTFTLCYCITFPPSTHTQCCLWVSTSSSGVWDSEWCGDTHWSRHQWERGLWSLSLSTHHHTTQPCLWTHHSKQMNLAWSPVCSISYSLWLLIGFWNRLCTKLNMVVWVQWEVSFPRECPHKQEVSQSGLSSPSYDSDHDIEPVQIVEQSRCCMFYPPCNKLVSLVQKLTSTIRAIASASAHCLHYSYSDY